MFMKRSGQLIKMEKEDYKIFKSVVLFRCAPSNLPAPAFDATFTKTYGVGLVYAEIELINGGDLEMARRGYMDQDEVKRLWVTALVETGSYMLAINENIQEQLQLPIVEKRKAQLADGRIVECDVVAPVEIKFKNRRSSCSAMVLPGDSEVLAYAHRLEDAPVRLPYYRIIH